MVCFTMPQLIIEKERQHGRYKKEQEHEELHRAIWAIADDLRGSVDG